jgi:N-acetylglucosaminyl-diphospho-decaprenol L-rhamnosyltransferase
MTTATSSVVVVSHRPGSWLAPCLAAALPQAAQVVVVDNGSQGCEASDIARAAGATVVRSERNLGFAAGINLGLRHARGELVAWLNDDAVPAPGWLETAEDVLADPTVAAVTPKVVLDGRFAEVILDDEEWSAPGDHRCLGRLLRSVTVAGEELLDQVVGVGVHDLEHAVVEGQNETWRWTSGRRPFYVPLAAPDSADSVRVNDDSVEVRAQCTLLNHAGNYLRPHGIAGDYGFAAPDDGRFDEPAERFGCSGTAPVMRADTLARLGGLAAPFFAYNEDTDWCLRARLAGLRIVYDPRATVRHRLSATSGGGGNASVRFLAQRNALLCLLRNAPADVAARHLWQRVREGPGGGVRRAVLTKAPWALVTRLRAERKWTVDPHDVWERWAGADTTWDTAPVRTASGAHDPGHQVDESGARPR